MAIESLYIPYQGTKAALMTLPSTGKKGAMAFTTDTFEYYADTGSGVGIGSAWVLIGGGAGGVVTVNGLAGAVMIIAGAGISVAVIGGNIVVTNTGTAGPVPVPNAVPIDSGDHIHFTLPSTPDTSLDPMLFKNGQLLVPGAGNDYLISIAAITLAVALDVSGPDPDILRSLYWT